MGGTSADVLRRTMDPLGEELEQNEDSSVGATPKKRQSQKMDVFSTYYRALMPNIEGCARDDKRQAQ